MPFTPRSEVSALSWTLDHQKSGRAILTRKLLRRGSFLAVADLTAQVLAFIAYDNRTMAKPFRWTFQGKALCV